VKRVGDLQGPLCASLTPSPNSPFPRRTLHPASCTLQGVLALREVVLGRWSVIDPQARQATLQFLLHTALAQLAAHPRPLLRTQVGAAAWVVRCSLG